MTSRLKSTWVLAGVAVLGSTLLYGRETQAGSIQGIVIKSGGSRQVGDPIYNYYFDVELTTGETLLANGYFTVYDLPGVTGNSLTQQPNANWGDSLQLLGLTPNNTNPPITDNPNIWNVTWVYHGPSITGASGGTDLGTFVVQTGEISPQPTPTLVYVATLDGTNYTDQGTVMVNAIVPEPSTVILLIAGTGVLPVLWLRQRRRRSSSKAGNLEA